MAGGNCWLVKSEPECFSIHDLAARPGQTTGWDGVRNYQARNFMRDGMQRGDRVLFYHSSAEPPAVAGTAVVAREAYPDATAWDRKSDHFDPKASPDNPIWQQVDIKLAEIFPAPVPIGALRGVPALGKMELLRTGSRLSVQPVTAQEFDAVVRLAHEMAAGAQGGADATAKPNAKSTRSKPARRTAKRATAPAKKKVKPRAGRKAKRAVVRR